jgi:hypothetical protein
MRKTLFSVIFCFSLFSNAFDVSFSCHPDTGRLVGPTEQTLGWGRWTAPVSALPQKHWEFWKWATEDGFESTANPLSVYVTRDMEIVALFRGATYTVRFKAGGNGSVEGPVTQNVLYGNPALPVTAVADGGYAFDAWIREDTGETVGKTATIEYGGVDANCTLLATFVPSDKLSVIFIPGPGGSLNGKAAQMVQRGGTAEPVEAVASPGYVFATWSGSMLSVGNPLTVTDVNKNMIIKANFLKDPSQSVVTVSAIPSEAGETKPAGKFSVKTGTGIDLTATPGDGYALHGFEVRPESNAELIVDGSSAKAKILGNVEIRAVFTDFNATFEPDFFTVTLAGAGKDRIRFRAKMANYKPFENSLTIIVGKSETNFDPTKWKENGVYGRQANYAAVFDEGVLGVRIIKADIGDLDVSAGIPVTILTDNSAVHVVLPVTEETVVTKLDSPGSLPPPKSVRFIRKVKNDGDVYSLNVVSGGAGPDSAESLVASDLEWKFDDPDCSSMYKGGKTWKARISSRNDPNERGRLFPTSGDVQFTVFDSQGAGSTVSGTVTTKRTTTHRK